MCVQGEAILFCVVQYCVALIKAAEAREELRDGEQKKEFTGDRGKKRQEKNRKNKRKRRCRRD